jgi:CBS domain-containing protein
MAPQRVRDIMNPTVVYLREGSRAAIALKPILEFGITAVPVLDEDERPVGIVSLRDLMKAPNERPEVSRQVFSVHDDANVDTAAKVLAESGVHHLVVIDGHGCAVGMLSALDVLRAISGLPPKHPKAIADFHEATP